MESTHAMMARLQLLGPPVPGAALLPKVGDAELGTLAKDLLITNLRAELYLAGERAREELRGKLAVLLFGLSAGIGFGAGDLMLQAALLLCGVAALVWQWWIHKTSVRPLAKICRGLRQGGDPVFDECKRRIAAMTPTRH